MSQYVSRWLKEQGEGSLLIEDVKFKAVVVTRATVEEWDKRDIKATHIPKGTIVIEVAKSLIPKTAAELETFNAQSLLAANLVKAFIVEGHSKTDGRPECRAIEADSIPADLPLLPFALSNLTE